jgi:hypothetical protein
MPGYTAGTLQRCFTGKLRAVVTQGSRHERYEFFTDEGALVASTVLSRGWTPSTSLSPRMTSVIQRELRLQGQSRLFHDLIRCPATRESWLTLIADDAR